MGLAWLAISVWLLTRKKGTPRAPLAQPLAG
jgi:hypothetical protein